MAGVAVIQGRELLSAPTAARSGDQVEPCAG